MRGWQCFFEIIRDVLDVLVFFSFGCLQNSDIVEQFRWSLNYVFFFCVCNCVVQCGVTFEKKIALGDFVRDRI